MTLFLNFYHYEAPLSVTFNLPKKKRSTNYFWTFSCMKFNCNSGGNYYCGNTVIILKHSKFTYFTTFITFQYFDGIEIHCKMQRLD